MSAPPPVTNLKVASFTNGTVQLNWSSAGCDKFILAWGPGATADAPVVNQIDIQGASGNVAFPVDHLQEGVSYVFKVEAGNKIPQTIPPLPGPAYAYSDWAALVWTGGSFILLYSQKGGRAFAAPIVGATTPQNGSTTVMGRWDTNWTQMTAFVLNGNSYLLTYKADGETFAAEFTNGANGPDIAAPTKMNGWAAGWEIITAFTYSGSPYVLTYRKGQAMISPLLAEQGPQIGTPVTVGGWEADWTVITTFTFRGNPYLLFYKANGQVFGAPIIAGAAGPANGDSFAIGQWDTGYTQIRSFNFNSAPYLLLYKQTGGKAYMAPILAASTGQPTVGNATQIGGWEADWTSIECFTFS